MKIAEVTQRTSLLPYWNVELRLRGGPDPQWLQAPVEDTDRRFLPECLAIRVTHRLRDGTKSRLDRGTKGPPNINDAHVSE
jgi:hypothetical protein